MKGYTTISNAEAVTEIISKSKFIANAARVDNVDEAVAFVAEITKKHYDATHNCYAYVIENAQKFSDNGEPSGTAGMPILDAIKKQKLDHVCVVVTRYFGGIKLGAGGLVRAYNGSAANVLTAATKAEISLVTPLKIKIPYNLLKITQAETEKSAKITSIQYDSDVTLCINVLSSDAKPFAAHIIDYTNGSAVIEIGEEFLGEY